MRRLRILLIEDDADDVQLLKEAIDDNNINCDVDVIMEGDRVMPILSNGNPLPDVIVMDLNLPKLHGKEILKLIRANKTLSRIPILVFTTSSSTADRQFVLNHGANQFITKPSSIDGFSVAINAIVTLANITT